MNRLVRGSVILAAAAVAWACGGLDTDGIDATAELVADPSVVFVNNRDSQAVFVEALNSLGQQLEGNFTVSNVGAGITVNLDTTFAPRPDVENLPTRVRYFVKASSITSFVSSSFTVTANGESVVVPVKITPDTLAGAVLDNAAPVIGDTIQLTAPAGIRFTPTTAITTPGDTSRRLANVGISADSSVLFILPGPDINAQALRLTGVQVQFHPGVNFNVNTDAVVTTPSLPAPLPTVTASNNNPAVGDTVSLTAPAPFGFTANSRVTLTGTGTGNAFVDVSADHSTLRFIVGPNSNGIATISNVALGGQASLGVMNLTTTAPIVSPPPPPFAATYNTASPTAGQQLVLTAPGGYRLLPTATATIGGKAVIRDSVSADSTKLYFVPQPGTSGAPSVTNAVLDFLLTVPLTVSATTPVNVGAVTSMTGTNSVGTAPTFALAASGSSVVLVDSGAFAGTSLAGFGANFPTRYYKVVVATDITINIRANWNNNDDLGVYIFDAGSCGAGPCDVGDIVDAADNAGGGAAGHPEIQNDIDLPAGTYYFGVVEFNTTAGPPFFHIRFTTQ
jgi:hypothetical protein